MGNFEDQLIGKGAVPWNHLFIQECVTIDVVMSAIAFCFSIRVVVAFFVGNVVQLLMTINIPEMTIKRNENGTCALGRTIGKFCVYVGLTLCN